MEASRNKKKKNRRKELYVLVSRLTAIQEQLEKHNSLFFFTVTEIVGHTQFTYMYELNLSRLVPNMHFFFF